MNIELLLIIFSVALILSLIRIDWAICLLIFLSPFHYFFKELYPFFITDIWRELFLMAILCAWLAQLAIGKLPPPRRNILNLIVSSYALWGIIGILRSYNLLVGLAGFRFMFAFMPLYFVLLSVSGKRDSMRKCTNAVIASGVILAIIGIIQFFLVSVFKIVEPRSMIGIANQFSGMSMKLGFYRAHSLLASDNEFGIFLVVCLSFVLAALYFSYGSKEKYNRRILFIAVIMGLAMLFSMSRSAIMSFIGAVVILNFFVFKRKIIIGAAVICLILIFVLPFSISMLFGSIFDLSDPYFSETLGEESKWDVFKDSPLMGYGFLITPSVAIKLGIEDPSLVGVGGVDIDFLNSVNQLGLIGFFLHFSILMFFIRNSFLASKSVFLSLEERQFATASFGVFIAMGISSLHLTPWYSVSLAATYYVLGGIVTYLGVKAKMASKIGTYKIEV